MPSIVLKALPTYSISFDSPNILRDRYISCFSDFTNEEMDSEK